MTISLLHLSIRPIKVHVHVFTSFKLPHWLLNKEEEKDKNSLDPSETVMTLILYAISCTLRQATQAKLYFPNRSALII